LQILWVSLRKCSPLPVPRINFYPSKEFCNTLNTNWLNSTFYILCGKIIFLHRELLWENADLCLKNLCLFCLRTIGIQRISVLQILCLGILGFLGFFCFSVKKTWLYVIQKLMVLLQRESLIIQWNKTIRRGLWCSAYLNVRATGGAVKSSLMSIATLSLWRGAGGEAWI